MEFAGLASGADGSGTHRVVKQYHFRECQGRSQGSFPLPLGEGQGEGLEGKGGDWVLDSAMAIG